ERLAQLDNDQIQEQIIRLAVVFKDQVALQKLRQTAHSAHHNAAHRRRAIDTLVEQRIAGFDSELLILLDDVAVRGAVLRGLAAFNSNHTPSAILSRYSQMDATDRQHAQLTLASREDWAEKLLQAIEDERF